MTGLAWSPDSRHVAYEVGWEGHDETRVVDAYGTGGTLDGGRDVEPGTAGEGGADRYGVAYRDAETLTTVRECCRDGTEDPAEEQRLLAVDPASGAERERLLDVAGRVASLDWDAAGRHLAYVTDDGALWLWSGGGEARRLASGFRAVAW